MEVRRCLLALLLLVCGCAVPNAPHRPYAAVPIPYTAQSTAQVQANLGWQDTRVALQAGDSIFLDAKGTWSGGVGGWTNNGPSGASGPHAGLIYSGEPSPTALIGRVGIGAPFSVRDQLLFDARESGTLQLRMNDPTTWDNSGALTVDIYVGRQEALTAKAPLPRPSVAPAPPPAAAPTSQGRRLALVIGNSAYREAPLRNPRNDARDIADTLQALGFEVILRQDADLKGMERAVDEFYAGLKKGGTGLFYFAGHGLQLGGVNYLVPIGARLNSESDVRYETVDAGRVLGKMEDAGNKLNIVILDACRNNPFARSFRSSVQGLAKMDAPTGSLIAYATAPDSVAADGTGRNGVYTEKLLQAIRMPGQPVELVFKRVRDEVMRATGDKQVPWESTSLRGDFYFTNP